MRPYFTDDEIEGLAPALVERLSAARKLAMVPFVITSGYRSPERNAAVGGGDNSAHLRGFAVDLSAHDSVSRFKIVKALFDAGFTRVVLYASDGHVHVDCDDTLPQGVLVVKP